MLLKIPDDLVLETEADVRGLRDFLDAFLRLKEHRTPNLPEPTITLPQPLAPAPKPAGKQPSVGPLYRQALRALGGVASAEEVYQKFVELGFKTKARNPRDAINTYLRHREEFIRLPPDDSGVTRWELKEEA